MLKFILRRFGDLYCFFEKFVTYPDDHTILGLPIDDDLQQMNRAQLCTFIENNSTAEGSFWDLDSTSKIRFGAQLLKDKVGESE